MKAQALSHRTERIDKKCSKVSEAFFSSFLFEPGTPCCQWFRGLFPYVPLLLLLG